MADPLETSPARLEPSDPSAPVPRVDEAPAPPVALGAAQGAFSPARRWIVSGLFCFLLAGIGYCVKTGEYAWPFTPHPMYAHRQGPTFGTRQLYGVSEQGEFKITSQVSPMGQDVLRKALSRMTGTGRSRALDTFIALYEARRAQNLGAENYPELLGLRIYESVWRVEAWAKNKDTPKKKLLTSRRLLTPTLEAEFAAQREGRAPAEGALRALPERDVLLELSEARASSAAGVHFVADARAHGGTAAVFPAPEKGKQAATLELSFEAEPGSYLVWLRGTSELDSAHASVELALDDRREALRRRSKKGFGNWRKRFPAGMYAWSSELPDERPTVLDIRTAGTHRLSVTAREGEARVDQIWLSRSQKDWPSTSQPLAAAAERAPSGDEGP